MKTNCLQFVAAKQSTLHCIADMDKCLVLKLQGHTEKANHPAVMVGFSQTGAGGGGGRVFCSGQRGW